MSIRKVNDVLQQVKCKPPEKMVLVVMADVADENGYCFPGIEYIRETACISRRTAINILQQMEERGDVYTHRTLGKHNRYIIMVNTSKEDFVTAAIEKLDMDEAQAVEAFLHVQNLAQGSANNAPVGGSANGAPVGRSAEFAPVRSAEFTPVGSAEFAPVGSAKIALVEGGAEIALVEPTSENECKNCTGAEIAPVQELCTTPVKTVAPDPSITINNNGRNQEPFVFSKEHWRTFLKEAQLAMSKPMYQSALATAEFDMVDESGEMPIVAIWAKDQYTADWLNGQGSLSLLLGLLGGRPAQLYARPKN